MSAAINRDDIEAKFRELQSEVDDTVESSMGAIFVAGVAGAVGLLIVAFLLGRRKGKKQSTVVEIRRV
ncbi:MAG: hypothetical protein U5K29_14215 [Acidimicrobiales bacterium]|nr:hypothetical protein [Acidimicrobiales bacterium]